MARIGASIAAGALAGSIVFVTARVLLGAVSGDPIAQSFGLVGIYALFGACIALVIALGYALWTRSVEAPSLLWVGAMAAASMYAIPVFHRVSYMLSFHEFSEAGVIAGGIGALLGYVAWIGVLGIASGPGRMWLALILGTTSAQTVILLNQQLFFSAVEWRALATDAGIAVATLFVASMHRVPRRTRNVIGVSAVAASIALLGLRGPSTAELRPVVRSESDQPNVIFILIDTTRADVFERVVAETDEGRRFAAALGDAAWFRKAVSAAPWTAPSVASIVTGLHPAEHGLQVAPRPHQNSPAPPMLALLPSAKTLAEELRDRGYVTDAIMTNAQLYPLTGVARGYMRYEMLSCASRSLPLLCALVHWEILPCHYADARTVRAEVREHLVDLEASGAPFFLWVHLMDPHSPLAPIRGLTDDPEGARLTGLDRLYRDRVRYALRELAGVIEQAATRPWWSRTVVVVTGDHGEMLPSDRRELHVLGFDGEPLYYGHGVSLHDELTRVPLVIRPSGGLPERRTLDVVASHVSLRSTILDLLELERPADARPSLAPWLSRAEPPSPSEGGTWAYMSSNPVGTQREAVRNDRFKLILHEADWARWELFDLVADPEERTNRAAAHPEALAHALAQLERIRKGLRSGELSDVVEVPDEIRVQLQALGYAQ